MNLSEILNELEYLNYGSEEVKTANMCGKPNSDRSTLYIFLGGHFTDLSEQWRVLEGLCSSLLSLKKCIYSDTLISVKQTGTVRSCCRKVLSIGVLPLLPFSVPHWPKPSNDMLSTTMQEKNQVIEISVLVIVDLLDCWYLKDVLKSDIGSIMAGLFYLLFYVKPPPKDRDLFKTALVKILDEFYQPDVIKNLMILHCSKGVNGKLCGAVRQILVKKMMNDGGVELLVSTVLVEGASTCDIVKLAQLIVNKHPIPGYIDKVLPQVPLLLMDKDTGCRQVGAQCYLLLQETNPTECDTYLLSPLLRPLAEPSSESEMETCLERLTNLFASTDRSIAPWFIAKKAVLPLTQSYCSIRNSVCHQKQKIKNLILQCLESAPKNELKQLILSLCFLSESNLNFILGDTGGLISTESLWEPYLDDPINSFLEVISSSQRLKSLLYCSLLENFSKFPVNQKLIASNSLSNMSTDTDILKDLSEEPTPVIAFINLLLRDESSDKDTLLVGLVVLNIIMNDTIMNKKRNWKLFDPIVEPLKNLRSKSTDGELRVLADDILNSLISKGITGASVALPTDLNSVRITEEKSDYETALAEVVDVHLPVRAHAIRQLGKLLRAKDSSALKNKQYLLALFKENLQDSDSFMYLSCVQSLSDAASEFPDEVLNILCDQFNHSKNAETRMKIGEVLLKTIQNLGEMAAVYKGELVHTFLVGCRDEDHLLRASSLSNLGELCKILSFRIGPFIIEIFDCILSICNTDRELEPRRAAVMVVSLILKGLGSHLFNTLEPILLEMYRKLKLIYSSDTDDVIKLHAQIALEELESHTRALLFPEQTFSKKISIIDS